MLDVGHIVEIIEKKGYSCAAVEKRLGFGNGAIRRWSVNSPSVSKLFILADFLKIPVSELLGAQPSLSADEKKLLDYYRSLSEDDRITALGDLIRFVGQSRMTAVKSKPPVRTVPIAAYGGGIIEHRIQATDEEIRAAIEEDEMDEAFSNGQ